MKLQVWVAFAAGLLAGDVAIAAQPATARFRVEQVIRVETTTAQARQLLGATHLEPVRSALEARVRFTLEQQLQSGGPPVAGLWRFSRVEVEGPRRDSSAGDAEVERSLALGLELMRQLEGREVSGNFRDLPGFPLGEAEPKRLSDWMRWATLGSFAGIEADPLNASGHHGEAVATYQIRWLRSAFRQAPCHVQEARWTLPIAPAAGAVPAELAAEGVEARTHFAAQSLEWVTQENPELMYAERSGVRETYWSLEKVQRPELQQLVFRLRLVVQVRVERIP
jgi:hypothetical protein